MGAGSRNPGFHDEAVEQQEERVVRNPEMQQQHLLEIFQVLIPSHWPQAVVPPRGG